MAHLVCRRRGDRVSVSSEDGQATITDGRFIRLLLSLGMVFPLLVEDCLAISTVLHRSLSSSKLSTAIYQKAAQRLGATLRQTPTWQSQILRWSPSNQIGLRYLRSSTSSRWHPYDFLRFVPERGRSGRMRRPSMKTSTSRRTLSASQAVVHVAHAHKGTNEVFRVMSSRISCVAMARSSSPPTAPRQPIERI